MNEETEIWNGLSAFWVRFLVGECASFDIGLVWSGYSGTAQYCLSPESKQQQQQQRENKNKHILTTSNCTEQNT